MTVRAESTPPVLAGLPRPTGPSPLELAPDVPEQAPILDNIYYLTKPVTVDSWQTEDASSIRTHSFQRLQLSGRRHSLLHTDPAIADPDNSLVIANISGWTETIHGPILRKTHAALSHELPDVTVDTHATYGTDGTLGRPYIRELAHLSLERMAQKTFEVFVPFYAGKQVVIAATSLSSGVWSHIEALNDEAGQPIEIVDRFLYEPFLVTPDHAGLPMFAKFGGHILLNTVDELVHHTAPKEIPTVLYDMVRSRSRVADWPAIGRQGLALRRGIPTEKVSALATHHPTVLQGDKDCLRDDAIVGNPDFILKAVLKKGHAMGLNPQKRARAIAKSIRESQPAT
jgi:hypothetical protein